MTDDPAARSPTAELLKEIMADLLVYMEQGRAEEFEIHLRAVTGLHAFLFEIAQPRDGPNYVLLSSEFTHNLGSQWAHEYSQLQRRAVEALERDTEFFGQCSYLGPRLYFALRDKVNPAALASVLNISNQLFFHLVNWCSDKHKADGFTGKPDCSYDLRQGLNETYGYAWRTFVAAWERLLDAFYPRFEAAPSWKQLTDPSVRLLDHLHKTSEMLGRSVWLGDRTAVLWSTDLLLKWGAHAKRAWDDSGDHTKWSVKPETLTHDLLERDWADVSQLPIAHFDSELSPAGVFDHVISNSLRDHIVVMTCILIHWALEYGDGGVATVAARMLMQDKPFDEGSADFRELGPITSRSGLQSLLRISGSGFHISKGYSAYFDHLAESLGRMSDAPYVSMRIYDSSYRLSFSNLFEEHALLLVAGAESGNPTAPTLLRGSDNDVVERQLDYLGRLRQTVAALGGEKHESVVDRIRTVGWEGSLDERKQSVLALIDVCVDLLSHSH